MGQQYDGSIVQINGVYLDYAQGGVRGDRISAIVEDASFSIQRGEKFVIIGPSGCGKTTLLKAIGGFLLPLRGEILLNGSAIKKPGPDRAVVFQDFEQLFAWRTVLGNIVYALQVTRKISKRQAIEKARYYLELVQVAAAADKYPHQLSGGMKQRAAIARALALEPDILLMDEPFGALDAITRGELQIELNEIWKRTGVTIVLVTHSIEEAIFLGSRVLVMSSSPALIREIVDTSRIEDFGDEAFSQLSRHLHSLLIRQKPVTEPVAELAGNAAN
ncbi:ABC transporter ATP-binding protein [Tengunoibacter tsumagoiensis]|uniref:ABC transporter ATP-binding protein n=1 Tax=Tengunoibacter tsumagoiensis TaxID=2014871 RepID=A0A402A0V3_9CHLR|nr:ABC transporter ATP-binding protein [Tengunoibacter tsumagoiensis]GCE12778.1 ABC transporter ATP-binding protein [Tengunoibacter tsumagoiensis]